MKQFAASINGTKTMDITQTHCIPLTGQMAGGNPARSIPTGIPAQNVCSGHIHTGWAPKIIWMAIESWADQLEQVYINKSVTKHIKVNLNKAYERLRLFVYKREYLIQKLR